MLDDHVLAAITLVLLALLKAGTTWSVGSRLEQTELVRRYPVLR